ncbi:MAG: S9 family peptidase [Desulfurococcales archaeon]|nr:S9 family peptidase [Desulfurococcales archaeon]
MPAKRPVESRDIYRLTLVSNPRVSPNGERVVFVASRAREDEYLSAIWVSDGERSRPLTGGPRDTCPTWSPEADMVAFTRRRNEKTYRLMIVGVEGGEPWTLARFNQPVTRLEWSPTGDSIAVESRMTEGAWTRYEDRDVLEVDRLPPWFNGVGWVFDRPRGVYLVSYPSGGVTRISPVGVDSWLPAWSPHGRYLAYVRHPSELEPYRGEVVLYDVETGRERVLVENVAVSGLAWSPDGELLALRGHFFERGLVTHHRIYTVNVETGDRECVTCQLDLNTLNTVNSDVRGPSCNSNMGWDDKGWLYFQVHEAGRVHVYRSRPGGEPILFLEAGNGVVDEFDVSPHGDTVAYTYMTPVKPKELYLYTGNSPVRATYFNDWVERERLLAEPQHQIVESPSGETLDLWILPPVGDSECTGCVPWVLYIHGGPKTSFGMGFMFEFHVLSGRGFAVVYGNPHGSDGYSEDFADIRGRYGTIDYEDIIQFANAAPSLYQALDPGRAAVAGGSYGGWMVNYILTRTSQFKAAVTMRSCSNWTSFYGASDIGWYFAREHLGGTPWESPETYLEKSPLFHLDKVKTPTLIIHSLEDYRCPLDQALALYTGLKALGVEAKLALFPRENHDLSRQGTPRRRVKRLDVIVEWLESKLGSEARAPGGDNSSGL